MEDQKRIFRAGTRPSRLALAQVKEIEALLGGVILEPVLIQTSGDRDKTTPLREVEGSDFFTRQIEEALINGEIDLAVHSAKDLEDTMPAGLEISACTASISPHECLVSRAGKRLAALPAGSVVGTSSSSRFRALAALRPDVTVKDLRGTIEERLRQLFADAYDAIIIAHAALIRLGYERLISEVIPQHIMPAHPLQGRLAVQIRADRGDLRALFRRIHASA